MMGFGITRQGILSLCGSVSTARGESLCASGSVSVAHYDAERMACQAFVKSKGVSAAVQVSRQADGRLRASCSICPAIGTYTRHCRHVAAVLYKLADLEREDSLSARLAAPPRRQEPDRTDDEPGIGESLLALFADKSRGLPASTRVLVDGRPLVNLEFTCRPVEAGSGSAVGLGRYLLSIELRAGLDRLYPVEDLRAFVNRAAQRTPYAVSKRFTYDPEQHGLRPADQDVIRQLADICRHEALYRRPTGMGGLPADGSLQTLAVPPVFWDALLPALQRAPRVRLEDGARSYEEIRLTGEALPLAFRLVREPDGDGEYRLDVQGLDGLTVFEAYGLALHDGKLRRLPPDSCRRLAELQRLLGVTGTAAVRLTEAQIESFADRVLPGLLKLGNVRLAPEVSDRLQQIPLKAKLFLDRVKDRLLAGLEFHYGDRIINPLEETPSRPGGGRILIREGEQERRILELLDEAGFARTESSLYLSGEEAECDFLHRIVPQLERLAQIYATSAVKERLFVPHAAPRIRADVDERTDWLECRFELEGFPPEEIRGLVRALEEKRRYYRLPRGALMPLETEALRGMIRFLQEVGAHAADLRGTSFRVPAIRGLRALDAAEGSEHVKLGPALRRMLDEMRHPDAAETPVPDSLAPILREYQRTGYRWLRMLARYRFGGILADDMGLGKTVQSISFLVSMLPEIRENGQPAVIVCPASLLYNWLHELRKFAPEIRPVVADGTQAARGALLAGAAAGCGQADVIITSYPLLLRDRQRYAAIPIHTLLLDEAQAIKNPAARTTQAVKSLHAKHRFALTGTPIENRLEELWSICDAVIPGLFPALAAFREWSREAVAKRVRPFLLRRMKADVLRELPEKIETVQAAGLLPEQRKLYLAYLAKLQKDSLKHLAGDRLLPEKRIQILAGLTRLRQLCCHPALFVQDYAGSSAKFELLVEILEECLDTGKRVLVFSQFTGMLAIIRRELGLRDVSHFYLDGQTSAAERVEICDRFNGGERDLFLISLRAGGTGLNLTGADTVILYDLWWNPAVEQQAIDRAHRFGQRNVVQVIRLVTQDTVEEKMYALQARKRQLVETVIPSDPAEEAFAGLTDEELRDILTLESDSP